MKTENKSATSNNSSPYLCNNQTCEKLSDKTSVPKYRFENKYLIDFYQTENIKQKLSAILEYDKNMCNGYYSIKSLYFDDYSDSCFYDNESGHDPREKYRIRLYNNDSSFIRFEIKRKERGKTFKQSCPISLEQVNSILQTGRINYSENDSPLLRKLFILQEIRGLIPKIIVEYERIPFVCRDGNVRVTVDTNIRSSPEVTSFLQQTNCRPIMGLGQYLLEVKYDDFLPDYISRTIDMRDLRKTAFSKYYLCRKFGGMY